MDEPLAPKRKPEVVSLDGDNTHELSDDSNKKQKLEISPADKDGPLIPDLEGSKGVSEAENNGSTAHNNGGEEGEETEDEDDFEDDEEDNDSEDEDEDDEPSNGGAEANDPKGKGIMKDVKGKGKLIEESEDSSDSGSESDGDLSDDPLAEVDLDNILPSRTRRCGVQPGVYISNDQGSKEDEDDDDSSS